MREKGAETASLAVGGDKRRQRYSFVNPSDDGCVVDADPQGSVTSVAVCPGYIGPVRGCWHLQNQLAAGGNVRSLSRVTVGRSAGVIGTAVFIVFKTIGHGSAPPTAVEDAKVTGRLLIRSQRFAVSPSLAPPAPTDCNMAACRIGRSQYGRTGEPRPRRPMISLDPARAAVATGSDVSCWRAGEPATVSGLPGGHCCPV